MKISTNAINNYTLQTVSQVNKPADIKKQELGSLSSDEKNFFVDVYPNYQNEIMDYHYYNKEGKMSGVSLGSNIDRRG
ncbi:hypothetical protein BMS3Abin03_02005 [bacterium BMS3Abin03]|nr:hypothetical protein BMS3Abin03_02005 [bacterium BMS3Abin03]